MGKPFHTLNPGMVERKAPGPCWNDAELQSVRRVTGRLSHVRESKKRQGFRSSKTSLFLPILIISSPVYLHTAFLDDFFWRSFPYTQAEAMRVVRTRAKSAPLSLRDCSCVCSKSTGFIRRVPDPRRVRKESPSVDE